MGFICTSVVPQGLKKLLPVHQCRVSAHWQKCYGLAEKKETDLFRQYFSVLKMMKLKQMFEFSLHYGQSKSRVIKSKD